jgi:hypothetical protein
MKRSILYLLELCVAVSIIGLTYALGHSNGYRAGRCETFDAFVVASGFPLDMRGGYKPPECR